MKILHIASGDGILGSARCLKELVMYEKENGHTPVVITPFKNEINTFCAENGIENHVVNYQQFMIPRHDPRPIYLIKYLSRGAEYYFKIRRAVRRVAEVTDLSTVDLIHTNVSVVSLGALLSKRYHIRHVWHLREFGREDFAFHSVIPAPIRFMNAHADRFIAVSDAVRNKWIERGLDARKIRTLYDGVAGSVPGGAPRSKKSARGTRAIMCGSISAAKGQLELIQALSLLRPSERDKISVDIYGTGTRQDIKAVQDAITRGGLTNARLKGFRGDIRGKLPAYDAGIVCSRAEAFGRVTVEYMFAGLYIIASDTGANPELLRNGECGLLYEKGNTAALADALRGAIEERGTSKTRTRAEERAKEMFDVSKNLGDVVQSFMETIQAGE